MNEAEGQQLANRISGFLNRHGTALTEIAPRITNVFEAACFVLFARHYEEAGYELRPKKLLKGRFRFRYSTQGLPWNFSYFEVLVTEQADEDETVLFEIRHNQKVAGAWVDTEGEDIEPALFAVDVAVIDAGVLPDPPMGQKRVDEPYWSNNDHLITFAEAKKLTAYPMLLAQFLGVVHEVKPEFLKVGDRQIPERFWAEKHPAPTLMTSNRLTWGTRRVLQSFAERKLVVGVVEDVMGLPEQMLLRKLSTTIAEHAPDDDEEIPL